jgi:hypothetical protein
LFHNSNLFGSCIIHILYTGVLKFKKKFRLQKVKIRLHFYLYSFKKTLHLHGVKTVLRT